MQNRWSLVALASGIVAGCGPASKETPMTVSVPPVKQIETEVRVDTNAANEAARILLAQIRSGKVTADELTIDFRKAIGEPLTPDEREKGYSDLAALEWIRIVSARLKGTNLSPVAIDSTRACYALDSGTFRIVKGSSRWQIDWFHAGRSESVAPLTGEETGKRFTLATFLDPLMTGNYDLSESVLSGSVKAMLAPPLGRDVGFNRGTLRGKLRNLPRNASGYSTHWNGMTATVTFAGSDSRPFPVTISPSGQVTAIELP